MTITWDGGISWDSGLTWDDEGGPQSLQIPVPPGRSRWRVLYASRVFGDTAPNILGELTTEIRTRRLETQLNTPSTFSFSMDGHSSAAYDLREGEHDILVYRWSERLGRDVEMGRFIVSQTQDTLSADRHTVSVTAHDYLWMLGNRSTTMIQNWAKTDQDNMVGYVVTYWARTFPNSQHVFFGTGAYLPLQLARLYPDNSAGRPLSGRVRDRTYESQQNIGDLLSNLSNVIDGFDYAVQPQPAGNYSGPDQLAVYYPYRGSERDFAFVYGSNVRAGTRTLNLANYGNYARVIGQAPEAPEGQPELPPIYAEVWQTSPPADDPISNPLGLWTLAESYSDISVQATLMEKAAGLLANAVGALDENGRPHPVPSYSLELLEYHEGDFGLGDTVRLQIYSGRLMIDTWVRVLAIRYVISDDAAETVEVDVGRPSPLYNRLMLERRRRDRLSALERR